MGKKEEQTVKKCVLPYHALIVVVLVLSVFVGIVSAGNGNYETKNSLSSTMAKSQPEEPSSILTITILNETTASGEWFINAPGEFSSYIPYETKRLEENINSLEKGVEDLLLQEVKNTKIIEGNDTIILTFDLQGNYTNSFVTGKFRYTYELNEYAPCFLNVLKIVIPQNKTLISVNPGVNAREGNVLIYLDYNWIYPLDIHFTEKTHSISVIMGEEWELPKPYLADSSELSEEKGLIRSELNEKHKSRFAEPNLWVGTGEDIVPGTLHSAELIANYYKPKLYLDLIWSDRCPDRVYYRIIKGKDSYAEFDADAYLIQYFAYWSDQNIPPHEYDFGPIFIYVESIGDRPYRVAYDHCDIIHSHKIHRTYSYFNPTDSFYKASYPTNDKAYYPYGNTPYSTYVYLLDISTSLTNNWDGNHVKLVIENTWHTFDTDIPGIFVKYCDYSLSPLTDEALKTAYKPPKLFGPEPFKYDVSDPFDGLFWEDHYHRASDFPTISGNIKSAVVNNEILTVKVSMFYDNTGAGGSPDQHLRGLWADRFGAKISTDTGYEDIGDPSEFDEQSDGEYILKYDVSGIDINSVLHLEVRDNVKVGKCDLDKDITFVSPEIQLTPSGRYFYDVVVNQCSKRHPFTIKNIGTGTATGSVDLTGSHADQFTIISGDGSFSLTKDATKTITVEFCPKSVGAKTATLFAKGTNCNNDASSLGGNGIQPEEPEIELTPQSHNFGNVQVGECSPTAKEFTIENIGTATATGSVHLTGSHADQFTITTVDKSFSLPEGDTKTITVEICPKSVGAKTATLYAACTNCEDDSSSLSGTCVQPEIQLTPPSHDFGNVPVGQCSPTAKEFTIENIGTATATGSVHLTGSHADQFTITTVDKSFSLPEGDTKTITVEFCPKSVGAKTATLYAACTNCEDDSSSLSGTCVQPPVADANGPYSGVIEYIAVPITFDGTGSYDPDGTIIKYAWDLDDDGKFDDAFGATPTVSFTAPYSGNIHLKVTDNNGATDTDTTTLTITKHSPPPNGIHGGLLTPPEQPQCYSGTSTIQGKGYFTIDERIQDWATAIDSIEHIEGTGEFEMASKKVLDQAANPLDFYDPNFYHKKTMQFQGNATNRLINREKFESSGIFGGTGTRINVTTHL